MPLILCRPKTLPVAKLAAVAKRSVAINPANGLEHRRVVRTPIGRRGGPKRLTVVRGRRWPATGRVLAVQFMDGETSELRKRILLHMNAWTRTTSVSFKQTRGTGEVRIARLARPAEMSGYWSYIGTEILEIDDDEPTMNLQGFTMRTPDEEFRRVVRHEAGHTLGFEHEHMRRAMVKRIDSRKAYDYFDRTQGWSRQEVDDQVLTPLASRSLMGTRESDPHSIMCYQLPGEITKDGKPIVGGVDINPRDYAFAGSVYPKARRRR